MDTPIYRVTGRDTLQQLHTQGRDRLHLIGGLFVWATSESGAEMIARDYSHRNDTGDN